ncbi:hypothetical protein FSP39_010010 [Pinctada imbricata]|uniref:Hemicentin-1-like von Willebrand factor A domain-containing protein n=1 Tax=Pinctada imbricata TaxID=66713 RepID=A0AA88YBI6_PINIB|nr:hypothetical protein FSP39_010010 [Pinctada imbricata]
MKRRSESQKASLVLVIDDTGSMGDDIVEVKEQLTKEVTLLTDDNLPQNFILVTFNDPVYYGTESVTESKTEILSKIDAILVGGGWDCPEYSIDGAIRGARLALNDSQLWLFTDAIAKDPGREDELVALLQEKKIIIHEFLRDPFCNTKRKRSIGSRSKRSAGYDVYPSVAMRTGGSFSIGSISQIGDWIRNLFRVYFPSSTAMIHYASMKTSDSSMTSIPVDTSVTLLKIEVIGTTTSSDVGLQYSNGTVVDFASMANIKTTTSTAVILSLTSLTAGELILQRHVNNPWQVNITAQTDVDFKVALLRYDSDGLLYTETANPLIGERYAIAVEIYNLNQNSSISNISLADSDGKLVLSTDAVGSIDEFYGYYIGDLIINNQTDFVIIDGTDQYGHPIRRTSSFPIKPTNVKLFVEELTRDLIINQVENITYTLTSHDAPNDTYVVNITDDKGYVIEPLIFEHVLETNETVSGSFQVLGTTASSVVTYFITLQTISSGEIIQQIKRKLLEEAVLSIAVIGGIVTCAVVLVVVFTFIIIVRIYTKQTPKQKVTDSFITLPDKGDIGKPPIDFKEKLASPSIDLKEKLEIIEL